MIRVHLLKCISEQRPSLCHVALQGQGGVRRVGGWEVRKGGAYIRARWERKEVRVMEG